MKLRGLADEILKGKVVTAEEATDLFCHAELDQLLETADHIREVSCGKNFDLCTILNAKSGRCSEDCSYCSQSVHHNTDIKVYALVDPEIALQAALDCEAKGAHRFSLVTSGRALHSRELDQVVETFHLLNKKCSLSLCASLGILPKEALQRLQEAGVVTYHHNLESGPNYFSKVCTTHTFVDRVNTVRAAQEAGLNVCSGGIIGLGEGPLDRMEMFFELRQLGVTSVPINSLVAIKGTRLEDLPPLQPEEILRTCAVARLILPGAMIRLAGGRELLGKSVSRALRGGVNALLTGDYLTTTGSKTAQDIELIHSAGYLLTKK